MAWVIPRKLKWHGWKEKVMHTLRWMSAHGFQSDSSTLVLLTSFNAFLSFPAMHRVLEHLASFAMAKLRNKSCALFGCDVRPSKIFKEQLPSTNQDILAHTFWIDFCFSTFYIFPLPFSSRFGRLSYCVNTIVFVVTRVDVGKT